MLATGQKQKTCGFQTGHERHMENYHALTKDAVKEKEYKEKVMNSIKRAGCDLELRHKKNRELVTMSPGRNHHKTNVLNITQV